MVNRENVMRLAQAFATQELATRDVGRIGYNQEHWESQLSDWSGNECGTTACVAGWAIHVLAPERLGDAKYGVGYGVVAQELLGLDVRQKQQLFCAGANPNGFRKGDRKHSTCTVAAVLKNLAETGVVDWEKASKEARKANGE